MKVKFTYHSVFIFIAVQSFRKSGKSQLESEGNEGHFKVAKLPECIFYMACFYKFFTFEDGTVFSPEEVIIVKLLILTGPAFENTIKGWGSDSPFVIFYFVLHDRVDRY